MRFSFYIYAQMHSHLKRSKRQFVFFGFHFSFLPCWRLFSDYFLLTLRPKRWQHLRMLNTRWMMTQNAFFPEHKTQKSLFPSRPFDFNCPCMRRIGLCVLVLESHSLSLPISAWKSVEGARTCKSSVEKYVREREWWMKKGSRRNRMSHAWKFSFLYMEWCARRLEMAQRRVMEEWTSCRHNNASQIMHAAFFFTYKFALDFEERTLKC